MPALAEATRSLASRCRFAPVPVYFDGRMLNDPNGPRRTPKEPFYVRVVERWLLSRRAAEELMAAPDPAHSPARYYDFDGTVQDLKLGFQVFLHQWRDEVGYKPLHGAIQKWK